MAGEAEELTGSEEEKARYGFERSEMYQSPLAGTVDPYDRHVFLCHKSYEVWPARVEDSDSDPLPKLFATALKARKNEIALKTRLTICEGGVDKNLSDGDVLIFPEKVKYRGLNDSNVESFVDDVLVHGKVWTHGVPEVLTGAYVFICCHNNRDRRCGVCGPVLIEKFKEVIESKDLKQSIQVSACSHIGGHKYAGNAIIFSTNAEEKIICNWYGYVTPDDVLELIDKQILQGEVVERLWRGQMGAPAVEAGKVDEPRSSSAANGTEKQPLHLNNTEKNAGGCCQGANGSSCCRSENLTSIKSRLAGWSGKFEQRQVITFALIGVVAAALVVAHNSFKRAR